jgi:preprotein translocase subunit SecD
LGLDLQGGIHLVLEVEAERAIEIALDRMAGNMTELFTEKKIQVESVKRTGPIEITVSLSAPAAKDEVFKVTDDQFPTLSGRPSSDRVLVYALKTDEAERMKKAAINQALETIRNRIDQFGVAEPLIQQQGLRQIVVQLPGVKDPGRAKALIKNTALLEFKMVDEGHNLLRQIENQSIPVGREEDVLREFGPQIPPEDEILFERKVDKETGRITKRPLLLKKRVALAGDVLTDARVQIGEFGTSVVAFRFDSTGAKIFERITSENVGKRMAVVLDNTVYSDPVIKGPIPGGSGVIEGSFTMEQANDLAIILRAGALPAPVKVIQDLTVGPSLGRDSIEKGIRSTLIAGGMVVLFMVIYYRRSGLIADFALMLNLILLVGLLAGFNATLTLPGIAGIILTIGMGVDSNVLMFERIREELRTGKPVRPAVDAGYDKAFLTILDSHVTTLITGFALFLFGTGPIKGFAVTLCLGIAINLFTALIGTKVIFDLLNRRGRMDRLSI